VTVRLVYKGNFWRLDPGEDLILKVKDREAYCQLISVKRRASTGEFRYILFLTDDLEKGIYRLDTGVPVYVIPAVWKKPDLGGFFKKVYSYLNGWYRYLRNAQPYGSPVDMSLSEGATKVIDELLSLITPQQTSQEQQYMEISDAS